MLKTYIKNTHLDELEPRIILYCWIFAHQIFCNVKMCSFISGDETYFLKFVSRNDKTPITPSTLNVLFESLLQEFQLIIETVFPCSTGELHMAFAAADLGWLLPRWCWLVVVDDWRKPVFLNGDINWTRSTTWVLSHLRLINSWMTNCSSWFVPKAKVTNASLFRRETRF